MPDQGGGGYLGLAGTFLGDVGEQARDELLRDATVVTVARGQRVFADPADSSRIAIVLDGTARQYIARADGRQLTVNYARSGSLIGTIPGTGGRLMTVVTQALTALELIEVSPHSLRRLQAEHPSATQAINVELDRRLDEVYRAFAMRIFGTITERVAGHVLDIAAPAMVGGLAAATTQHELGGALGTAREVAARALHVLQKRGLVRISRGDIAVLDVRGLVSAAGEWWLRPRLFLADVLAHGDQSFDRSPVPVIAIDGGASIVYANAPVEAVFGWAPRELIGHPMSELLSIAANQRFDRMFNGDITAVRSGPIGLGAELHGRRRDGSDFPADVTMYPVRGTGRVAVYATVIDLTYKEALRARLAGRSATVASPVAVPSAALA